MGYRFIFHYLTLLAFQYDFSKCFYIKTYSITGEYSYIYKNIYQFIQKEIRSTLENLSYLIRQISTDFYNLSIMRFIRTSSLYFYFDKTSRSYHIFRFPVLFSRVIILNRLDIKLRVIRVVYPGFGLVGTFAFLLIEVIRGAVRPFALYLRLLVNIVAGHLIDRIIIKLGPLFFSIHFYPRIFLGVSYLITLHI